VCCGAHGGVPLWAAEIPEIFPISDWVAMLKHGKIIAMAPSKELSIQNIQRDENLFS